ncbi:MAG: hypothetical protein AABZ35_06070 [Gemmatimonadota bacterium]|jgi:GNAT superfamily N-acetyltransferase
MPLGLTPVRTGRDLKRFIYLPERLHRDHPKWMPPIYWDEWDYFSPRKNRAFGYCDTTLALAHRDGELVGRVMGIVNRRHNEKMGDTTARFSCLESTEDPEVAHALLAWVEDWARGLGMTKIVGPLGFTDQDPEGFMVEGFDQEPTIVTYYNFPYIVRFLEAEGYTKEIDYVVYRVPVPPEVPEFFEKVADRVSRRGEFKLVEFVSKSQAKPYIRPVLALMNETFAEIYGYSPLDEMEMTELAKKYLPLLDPRFVKVVEKDGQVVAFIIAMPNLYEGIVKSRGRLFPFGFIHILRAAKRAKQLDLLLAGIKEEYRGRGLDMLMGRAILRSAIPAGFTVMDSHHEIETNTKVRAEMERGGGQVYKRYRIFRKALDSA